MTMESIERMREYAENLALGHVDDIEPEIVAQFVNAHANEVEREVAEHYIALPLDADGVPWHVGETAYCGRYPDGFTVYGIEFTDNEGTRLYEDNDRWALADACNHVRRPTVEDVLREYHRKRNREGVAHVRGELHARDVNELTAEYAAKVREAVRAE